MQGQNKLIVSEKKRPFFQLLIAAVLFTAAFGFLVYSFFYFGISNYTSKGLIRVFELFFYIIIGAFGFCSSKKVYIDLEHSKFRPVIEVLGFKFGSWTTIHNYEYVSVFYGSHTYEVNLWYNKNKHLELYRNKDLEEVFIFGYNVSQDLNIDLLDATKQESVWVDKEEWQQKMNN
jgi:hypothetical protein